MNARRPPNPKTARAKAKPAASRDAIVSLLDKTLRTSEISDRSVNGLQVEGVSEVARVGLAVDACLEAYKLAHAKGCQMVIAHHGIIWEGIKSIRGPLYRQIEFLVKSGVSLYASHLPLDLHPTLGNNARIAKALGLKNIAPFGVYRGGCIGFEGSFPAPVTLKSVADLVKKRFGGPTSALPFGPPKIRRAAIISGGGTAALPEAIEKKIDLFVTGESSHENHHAALEGKINVVYGGHYHTEKPGVIALGEFLNKKFGIDAVFLDVPTMV
ncbi:MAG: Nif3-like dinuclear metal center hexameric protein [Chitinispirillales bacterium]|jgi:dinuclear metal center YbgI/SA1388 family protein|nr:Nif3-like dinuclear metal center hexameric protein [Chitinispirillales bacterium]